jgi:hypothetical protein
MASLSRRRQDRHNRLNGLGRLAFKVGGFAFVGARDHNPTGSQGRRCDQFLPLIIACPFGQTAQTMSCP